MIWSRSPYNSLFSSDLFCFFSFSSLWVLCEGWNKERTEEEKEEEEEEEEEEEGGSRRRVKEEAGHKEQQVKRRCLSFFGNRGRFWTLSVSSYWWGRDGGVGGLALGSVPRWLVTSSSVRSSHAFQFPTSFCTRLGISHFLLLLLLLFFLFLRWLFIRSSSVSLLSRCRRRVFFPLLPFSSIAVVFVMDHRVAISSARQHSRRNDRRNNETGRRTSAMNIRSSIDHLGSANLVAIEVAASVSSSRQDAQCRGPSEDLLFPVFASVCFFWSSSRLLLLCRRRPSSCVSAGFGAHASGRVLERHITHTKKTTKGQTRGLLSLNLRGRGGNVDGPAVFFGRL